MPRGLVALFGGLGGPGSAAFVAPVLREPRTAATALRERGR